MAQIAGSSISCASGWHQMNQRCFYISNVSEIVRTFTEGESACIKKNTKAHLASIHSNTEDNFILANAPGQKIWLGGSDEGKEGSWFWKDGSPWTYSHWGGDQPDKGEEENCLMISEREWHDVKCAGDWFTHASGYACSYRLDGD